MAATPFDTLKLARRLESAGFPAQQAGDTADALAEALSEFATKAEIVKPRADTPVIREESKAETELLRLQIKIVSRDIVIQVGGMIVIAVWVLLFGMRFVVVVH